MHLRVLLLLFLPLAVLASPVRSNMGGEELSRLNPDDGPQNLWVWPTEVQSIRKYLGPNSVWVPQMGVWYVCISERGWIDTNSSIYSLVDYSADSVTTTYRGGYSAGTFLPLESGNYVISALVDGDSCFTMGCYELLDNGYKWKSEKTLGRQFEAGYYEKFFTIPDGISLVSLILTSRRENQEQPLTVTDIEIYRID